MGASVTCHILQCVDIYLYNLPKWKPPYTFAYNCFHDDAQVYSGGHVGFTQIQNKNYIQVFIRVVTLLLSNCNLKKKKHTKCELYSKYMAVGWHVTAILD